MLAPFVLKVLQKQNPLIMTFEPGTYDTVACFVNIRGKRFKTQYLFSDFLLIIKVNIVTCDDNIFEVKPELLDLVLSHTQTLPYNCVS